MGRLPAKFAGKLITFRVPFSMPGELLVAANAQGQQFPEATFLNSTDKPFEVHRMVVRLTAFDGQDPPVILDTQPGDILFKTIRLRVLDLSKNELLTKSTHLASLFLRQNELTWEWTDPYTLVRSNGFIVTVDADNFPTGTSNVRVEVAFQGFRTVIAPPTETR